MFRFLDRISKKLREFHITNIPQDAEKSESRDIQEAKSRDIESMPFLRSAEKCPYCASLDFVKRGLRKKKLETVQLYLCKSCGRAFTAPAEKYKHFPLRIIIDGLNFYNLGFDYASCCRFLEKKFSMNPGPDTLALWVKEYAELCRFSRMRDFAVKLYEPKNMVETVTMAHRQLYRFRYHRGKIRLILSEYPNRRFERLKEYLDGVSAETPHQYFQDGLRISEVRSKFDKAQMIVRGKHNFANRLAEFVLRAVTENKARHEELQRFFIANDSVTVATEVPVYIRREDIEHMENQLKFKILELPVAEIEGMLNTSMGTKGTASKATAISAAGRPVADIEGALSLSIRTKGTARPHADRPVAEIESMLNTSKLDGLTRRQYRHGDARHGEGMPRLLTGHIDFLQIRNGMVHILDYKPNAAKEKPIEQLTWYALALSRLTGLRLYEFKCAWFDEKDYFEFYPLHVVHKLSDRKRAKRIKLKSGELVSIPGKNVFQVV